MDVTLVLLAMVLTEPSCRMIWARPWLHHRSPIRARIRIVFLAIFVFTILVRSLGTLFPLAPQSATQNVNRRIRNQNSRNGREAARSEAEGSNGTEVTEGDGCWQHVLSGGLTVVADIWRGVPAERESCVLSGRPVPQNPFLNGEVADPINSWPDE